MIGWKMCCVYVCACVRVLQNRCQMKWLKIDTLLSMFSVSSYLFSAMVTHSSGTFSILILLAENYIFPSAIYQKYCKAIQNSKLLLKFSTASEEN